MRKTCKISYSRYLYSGEKKKKILKVIILSLSISPCYLVQADSMIYCSRIWLELGEINFPEMLAITHQAFSSSHRKS